VPRDSREANALTVDEKMPIANLHHAHAKRIAMLVQWFPVPVRNVNDHAVDVRMINAPQTRHRQRQSQRDVRGAGLDRYRAHRGRVRVIVGAVGGGANFE
jgi:hypothetical protein